MTKVLNNNIRIHAMLDASNFGHNIAYPRTTWILWGEHHVHKVSHAGSRTRLNVFFGSFPESLKRFGHESVGTPLKLFLFVKTWDPCLTKSWCCEDFMLVRYLWYSQLALISRRSDFLFNLKAGHDKASVDIHISHKIIIQWPASRTRSRVEHWSDIAYNYRHM